MWNTLINIKDTELEIFFKKDILSIEELVNSYLDQCVEIDILKEKLEDCKEIVDNDYSDEYHEMKMIGEIE